MIVQTSLSDKMVVTVLPFIPAHNDVLSHILWFITITGVRCPLSRNSTFIHISWDGYWGHMVRTLTTEIIFPARFPSSTVLMHSFFQSFGGLGICVVQTDEGALFYMTAADISSALSSLFSVVLFGQTNPIALS